MSRGSKFDRHSTLFRRMSDALGIDVDARAQSGDFPPEDEIEVVQRCIGCLSPEGCEALLASGAPLQAPPDYCRNRKQLMGLRSDD